ncbi:pantoate kinase [Pyrococcus sp. ST04]|uniref:pantoate kinase n=1 Tax=Pyrococcus sp. ST04 TaxID=1183377 RepID=UPI0002605FA5|nr:pantoate kinase [Pyrococcus sp. ST04]AFK23325.1 putative GHMP kinase [Pyrococcus sp. ST04]
MLIRAFVPAHVTAFFVPVIREDPQLSGSLGAGINLDKGTNVFLNIENGLEKHIHVAFNGEPVKKEDAKITYHVAEKIIPKNFVGDIEIWQYFDFPNGYGFGNSAGGALGTALVLAYRFGLTLLEAAKIAHEAEVTHGGGLGDVVSQLVGGVEIRVKAGGPGIAVVDNILTEGYKVFVIPLGRLRTKEILDSEVIANIRRAGEEALKNLLRNPTPENLMKTAKNFAIGTGLMDEELLEIAREIEKVNSLPASMIMLGKGVFTLVKGEDVEKVKGVVQELNLPYDVANIYWGKPIVGRWIESE